MTPIVRACRCAALPLSVGAHAWGRERACARSADDDADRDDDDGTDDDGDDDDGDDERPTRDDDGRREPKLRLSKAEIAIAESRSCDCRKPKLP